MRKHTLGLIEGVLRIMPRRNMAWRIFHAGIFLLSLGASQVLGAPAQVTVTKTSSVSVASIGDTVVYSVIVTNNNTADANAMFISDVLPAGFSHAGHGASQGTYDPVSGEWNVGNVKKQKQATLTITGQVVCGVSPILANVARYVTSENEDITPADNTSTALVTVIFAATNDFGVGKSADVVADVALGDTINFTLSVTNFGPLAATNVVVKDLLSSAFTYVTNSAGSLYDESTGLWQAGDLGAGASTSVVLTVTLAGPGRGQSNVNTVVFQSAQTAAGECMLDDVVANNSASVAVLGSRGTDPDMDLPPINLEVIGAGALIIAMDTNYQAVVSPFNLKAYGLVNDLLWSNIPVKWAIAAGKTNSETEADFTASTVRLFPTAIGTPSNRSFHAGPFIITSQYLARATAVISNYGNSVAVYQAVSNFTADIRYTLRSKPKVAVMDANSAIHIGKLQRGGIATSHYSVVTVDDVKAFAATSCFSIITAPHNDASAEEASAIASFIDSGGNFLAQCHSVDTYENQGFWHSTAGIFKDSAFGEPDVYFNADAAYAQFQGLIDPGQGGSLTRFDFLTNSAAKNGHFIINNSDSAPSTRYGIRAAQAKTRPPGQKGGIVFYLGGHQYSGTTLDQINGQRAYLNAILMPADRPTECGLAIESDLSVTKDDFVEYVLAGQVLTYTIEVGNSGPFSVTNITVTDVFPPGLTNVTWTNAVYDGGYGAASVPATSGSGNINQSVDLPKQSYIIYTVTAGVDPGFGLVVSNRVFLTLPESVIDSDYSNNEDSDVDIIIAPGLSLQKTVSDVGASPGVESVSGTNGTPVLYSMIVSNTGDSTITNVCIEDPAISVNDCSIGSLAAGQTATVTAQVAISGDLTNSAVVTANDLAGNPLSDTNTAIVLALYHIVGSVWLDVNADGNFDAADTNGLTNVTITLCKVEGGVTSVVTSTTTGLDGSYAFTNLSAGTYIVKETDPGGYFSTTPNEVEKTLSTSSGSTEEVNFLDALLLTIGDYTWRDQNKDGLQDAGEPPVAGVVLTLYNAASNVLNVTTSSASGVYIFTNVTPGSYFIRVLIPSGRQLTKANQGGDDSIDSDMVPLLLSGTGLFVLSPGINRDDIDAGFIESLTSARIRHVEARSGSDGRPEVTWKTWPESGVAAWLVEREQAPGTWIAIGEPVPAAGDAASGATYALPDDGVSAGSTHRYRIREIGVNGIIHDATGDELTFPQPDETR